jgi:hypothetical protein
LYCCINRLLHKLCSANQRQRLSCKPTALAAQPGVGKAASSTTLLTHLFPAGQQHQRSSWPRKDDPVLEHLLRDFRSAKLRRQFFSHDAKEYSETLDVKVLVSHAAGGGAEAASSKPCSDRNRGAELTRHTVAAGCGEWLWLHHLQLETGAGMQVTVQRMAKCWCRHQATLQICVSLADYYSVLMIHQRPTATHWLTMPL